MPIMGLMSLPNVPASFALMGTILGVIVVPPVILGLLFVIARATAVP